MSIRYLEAETRTVIDDLEAADRICLFWEMFEKLSNDCQQLMRMSFEEQPTEEIQTALGFDNPGSVKVKKFKCKEHLVKLIQADPRFAELAEQ
ncbi:MAG: hypothetical protein IPL81_10405 [Flavobacteriales bacterium]|nr:hypothetical protein [Flavobacteriales bacterium]MBK9060254.1 hypothetical protein [Flavobacteriales bacterium]QQS71691.1 MAG: hypothetical protein IPP95_10895 [Flavobacteriales bacterium]HQV40294.1 hypothetical protein [Flavobacteriales bacterium]HQW33302.1 hypothetical protein [Flavobacteriales bacterium]